eukprot:1158426-Pelagomonas_calceolata.AAC.8
MQLPNGCAYDENHLHQLRSLDGATSLVCRLHGIIANPFVSSVLALADNTPSNAFHLLSVPSVVSVLVTSPNCSLGGVSRNDLRALCFPGPQGCMCLCKHIKKEESTAVFNACGHRCLSLCKRLRREKVSASVQASKAGLIDPVELERRSNGVKDFFYEHLKLDPTDINKTYINYLVRCVALCLQTRCTLIACGALCLYHNAVLSLERDGTWFTERCHRSRCLATGLEQDGAAGLNVCQWHQLGSVSASGTKSKHLWFVCCPDIGDQLGSVSVSGTHFSTCIACALHKLDTSLAPCLPVALVLRTCVACTVCVPDAAALLASVYVVSSFAIRLLPGLRCLACWALVLHTKANVIAERVPRAREDDLVPFLEKLESKASSLNITDIQLSLASLVGSRGHRRALNAWHAW